MLDLRGVDAYYGDSHILHKIELKIAAQARIAILGRNGAGKSTLLKSIMNAGPRVRGNVVWDGVELGDMATWRRARLGIALVPEDRRIFGHLTSLENLAIAQHAVRRGAARRDPREILRRIPMLRPLEDRLGSNMSGGQQQMLAVARGIASQPRLMLLDEPTEGLAPVIVEQMAHDVVEVCEQAGTALLLCEQNIWFSRACTTYAYVIDSGRIVFEGDWGRFNANPDIVNRYLAV